jgi:hypothetical protein
LFAPGVQCLVPDFPGDILKGYSLGYLRSRKDVLEDILEDIFIAFPLNLSLRISSKDIFLLIRVTYHLDLS